METEVKASSALDYFPRTNFALVWELPGEVTRKRYRSIIDAKSDLEIDDLMAYNHDRGCSASHNLIQRAPALSHASIQRRVTAR